MSNIQIKTKTDNGYSNIYPTSDAVHTDRQSKIISYLEGSNLLEIVQNTANTYLNPDCTQWFEQENKGVFDANSRICAIDNFICIITPKVVNNIYTLYCTVSHNGGITWGNTTFIPSTGNQILEIIGIECARILNTNYEVTIVGKQYLSENQVYTYQLYIPHNSFVITQSKELNVINTNS